MKPIFLPGFMLLAAGLGVAHGSPRSKADNSFDLHLATCWFTAAPGPGDVASFDFYPTAASPRSTMTTDLSWGGIAVANTSLNGCRFGPASATTGFHTLTLGAAGISANGTTNNNKGLVLTTDLLLAADQTWTGAPGASVLVSGNYRPEGSFIDLGGKTLDINGISVKFQAPLPTTYAIGNGTIRLNTGASLRINGGSRPTGVDPDPVCEVRSSVTFQVNAGASLTPWNSAFTENLQWNAAVVLNGGTLFASGFEAYGAGIAAASNNNTVAGTIQVNASSNIELSAEIADATNPQTLHKITAPISGNAALSIKNASQATGLNWIVLSGDNSGLLGPVSVNAASGCGRVRLASNTAGSPGPWSVAADNTLEIENSAVSMGYVTGAGTIEAIGGGASTLQLNSPGTALRTFSGAVIRATGSVLHLRKAGTYSQTISGNPGWNGNTFVDGGKLTINRAVLTDDSEVHIATGAILRLTHGKVDRVGKLFLVGVGGVEQPAGTWGATGSGADHETAMIEGSGFLRVGAPPTTYEAWIESIEGLSGQASREPLADPDGDGTDNFSEFAFAGDPVSGTNGGRISSETGTKLRLIVAMRTGAVFGNVGGEQVSAAVDGLIYRVQAATDPGAFPAGSVSEIAGFTPPPELPALASGWEYRGFETTQPVSSEPRQFLRAVAQSTP